VLEVEVRSGGVGKALKGRKKIAKGSALGIVAKPQAVHSCRLQ